MIKTEQELVDEIRLRNRLIYPTERITITMNVEEQARRLYFQSTEWDTWDGRWWTDLAEDERQRWMEIARGWIVGMGEGEAGA